MTLIRLERWSRYVAAQYINSIKEFLYRSRFILLLAFLFALPPLFSNELDVSLWARLHFGLVFAGLAMIFQFFWLAVFIHSFFSLRNKDYEANDKQLNKLRALCVFCGVASCFIGIKLFVFSGLAPTSFSIEALHGIARPLVQFITGLGLSSVLFCLIPLIIKWSKEKDVT